MDHGALTDMSGGELLSHYLDAHDPRYSWVDVRAEVLRRLKIPSPEGRKEATTEPEPSTSGDSATEAREPISLGSLAPTPSSLLAAAHERFELLSAKHDKLTAEVQKLRQDAEWDNEEYDEIADLLTEAGVPDVEPGAMLGEKLLMSLKTRIEFLILMRQPEPSDKP